MRSMSARACAWDVSFQVQLLCFLPLCFIQQMLYLPGFPMDKTCANYSTCVQVIDLLQSDQRFEGKLQNPSVSCGSDNLYMRGVFEAETRPNLSKVIFLWFPWTSKIPDNDWTCNSQISSSSTRLIQHSVEAGLMRSGLRVSPRLPNTSSFHLSSFCSWVCPKCPDDCCSVTHNI